MKVEFVLIWLAFAVVTALAANARGHSAVLWFFIGVLFGVFALIAVLVIRPGDGAADGAMLPDGWATTASTGPSGPAVSSCNGVLIHQNGTGFWAQGQSFATIEAAERHIRADPV